MRGLVEREPPRHSLVACRELAGGAQPERALDLVPSRSFLAGDLRVRGPRSRALEELAAEARAHPLPCRQLLV